MNGRSSSSRRHISFRSLGWLAVLALVALSALAPVSVAAVSSNANNGTLKIHEQGTPSGTEENDPKVCVFNIEGFGFDAGQTGWIVFETQGGDQPTGTNAGPFDFGPADANGFYATAYFNLDPGHYQAALLGKKDAQGNVSDVKAKSKVFKVDCATTAPTPTPTAAPVGPTPTPTATPTPTPTPTPGGGEEAATPTPTPNGGVSGATAKPRHTLPPTDTVLAPAASSVRSDAWRMLVMALAAFLATTLLLTPARSSIRRR
jgi:hypothetical protein